ncbi:putative hydro-lyase [Thalassotalea sp. G2M2-11]|uniref:putative hydro-lyase n=1 Tax=Thalassotalea sp. G2M2-11 TaxID=2787627 RepID=UPI0019CFEFFF|nr:putative hydro-lyase [Thalassotalea sp. G2M2-11]
MNKANLSPETIREQIRAGSWTSHTSGVAKGFVQCNVVIMPAADAKDFETFCQLNAKACPIIAKSTHPGSPYISVGDDYVADIRTDIPSYCVYENGNLVDQPQAIEELWRDDLVTFLLGCSFSFEEALLAESVEVRNITEQVNVPMFNTNIPNKSVGKFKGNMVVSMRPMPASDAIKAIQICSKFPKVHGAPIHIANPEFIGITDISKPDYGDAVTLHPEDLPVFWACGVTPQNAIKQAQLAFCITHSPGCMLVTNMLNSDLMTRAC